MSGHKFKVNQLVDLSDSDRGLTRLGQFAIVRVLPTEHGISQYRIRSVKDGHERVVVESEIA